MLSPSPLSDSALLHSDPSTWYTPSRKAVVVVSFGGIFVPNSRSCSENDISFPHAFIVSSRFDCKSFPVAFWYAAFLSMYRLFSFVFIPCSLSLVSSCCLSFLKYLDISPPTVLSFSSMSCLYGVANAMFVSVICAKENSFVCPFSCVFKSISAASSS